MGASGSRGGSPEVPRLAVAQRVVGEWAPGRWAPGVVEALHGDLCDVLYDDGQRQYRVRRGLLSTDLPRWWLECGAGDCGGPVQLRPDEHSGSQQLRVGRAVQAVDVWERLVPDEVARNTISREHFDVHCGSDMRFLIKNLSSKGTFLNGALLHGEAPLRVGDAVAAGLLAGEGGLRPALVFRLALRPWAAGEALPAGGEDAPQPAAARATPPAAPGAAPPRGGAPPTLLPPPPSAPPVPKVLAREPPSGAAAAPPPRVEPARAAPEGVVTINLSFLPPPFALRCTFSRALAASDLERIPVEERTLEASCQEARLLVGRAAQPAALWERLLPEETLRRAVSPEHFEIAVDEEAELVLRNLSSTGTLVNGKTITDSVRVQHADVITVRASARDDVAVLVFRLSVAGEQEDEDSVFSDCPSCSSFAEAGRPRLATESTIIDSGYIAATPLLGLLQRESTAHQREWMCLQREGTLLREWTSGSRAMGDDCIRQAAVRDAAVRPPPVAAVRWPIMPPVREEQGAIEI